MLTGEYLAVNNVWNKAAADGGEYSQVVYVRRVADGWAGSFEWSWPYGLGGVKAYPEVSFGKSPWNSNPSTVPWLPVLVSDVPQINVEFDLQTTVSDGSAYNSSFDIWFTYNDKVVVELMILVDHVGMPPSDNVGTFEIDGGSYELRLFNAAHNLYVFSRKTMLRSGAIAIDKFIKFLVDTDLISPEFILMDVEFGNEIINGTGKTIINNYKVTKLE